jgi:hypothetical protein
MQTLQHLTFWDGFILWKTSIITTLKENDSLLNFISSGGEASPPTNIIFCHTFDLPPDRVLKHTKQFLWKIFFSENKYVVSLMSEYFK